MVFGPSSTGPTIRACYSTRSLQQPFSSGYDGSPWPTVRSSSLQAAVHWRHQTRPDRRPLRLLVTSSTGASNTLVCVLCAFAAHIAALVVENHRRGIGPDICLVRYPPPPGPPQFPSSDPPIPRARTCRVPSVSLSLTGGMSDSAKSFLLLPDLSHAPDRPVPDLQTSAELSDHVAAG